MQTTTLHSTENFAETAKQFYHKAVDYLYGTPARTNRTLLFIMAAVVSAKLLETMVVVPYCGV